MNTSILAPAVIQGALSFQSPFQSLLESRGLIESSESLKSSPCGAQHSGMLTKARQSGITSPLYTLGCQAWLGGAK
jgi:hypothetical protein